MLGSATGRPIAANRNRLKTEIKAATYHDLKINKTAGDILLKLYSTYRPKFDAKVLAIPQGLRYQDFDIAKSGCKLGISPKCQAILGLRPRIGR